MEEIKCVLVGDPGSGKDEIIEHYTRLHKASDITNVNGKYIIPFMSGSHKHKLCILSVSGLETNKRRRQLCYWDTDVFVICYDVSRPQALTNIETEWIPELESFCKDELKHRVPLVVAGLQLQETDQSEKCSTQDVKFKSSDLQLECSLQQESISTLFAEAFQIAMDFRKRRKSVQE